MSVRWETPPVDDAESVRHRLEGAAFVYGTDMRGSCVVRVQEDRLPDLACPDSRFIQILALTIFLPAIFATSP